MPPLTYIHGFETARTTAGGRVLTACGGGGWLTAEAGMATPPKRLIFSDFCAEAQEHGDGTFRPTAGRGVPSSAVSVARGQTGITIINQSRYENKNQNPLEL